jgi:dTDP-4-dehydrorhamnose reductase
MTRRVAITGADGQLGRQLVTTFSRAGWDVLGLGRDRVDLSSSDSVHKLTAGNPAVVVNAAAWTDVDGCARDPDRARLVNGIAAGWVARAAAEREALIVQISTNEVFDGTSARPYAEDAEPRPINPYGESKLLGEQEVAAANPHHLIVRTAWTFGPGGRNFPAKILEVARRQVEAGEAVRVVFDELGNPTWAPDLASGILQAVGLALDGRIRTTVLHLAGEPATSRFAWADAILAGLPGIDLLPISADDYPRPSRVPRQAVLSTERARSLGIAPSDWRTATASYVAELLSTTVPG